MAATAGLKPFEVDWMAPSDVWLCIDGYNDREKLEWERTRELAFWIHIHSMADKKKKSPQDLRPFPWDVDESGKPMQASNPKEIWDAWQRMKAEKQKQDGRDH